MPTARVRRRGSFPLVPTLLVVLSILVSHAAALALERGPVREVARPEFVPPQSDGQLPVLLETSFAPGVAARIEELGGRVTRVFENADLVSATLPEAALPLLRADDRVGAVSRQRLVHLAEVEPRLPGLGEVPERHRRPRTSQADAHSRTRPVSAADRHALQRGDRVSFIGYDRISAAEQVGAEADWGAGTVVAIIDTGVYDQHPLFQGNVVGGMNLVPADEEMAIDLDGDHVGDGRHFDWNRVENNGHGTFVAGMIAGHALVEFDAADPLLQIILKYSPESVELDGLGGATLHMQGPAPEASLFGVKVFPYDGGSAPDARVAEAIDRLITMKRDGSLHVDVINMSLSGPVLYDGHNPLDRLVDAATRHGITSVVAASNDGPAMTTVGSPGSAFSALTVGAALDPVHTRVAVERFFGLPGDIFFPHADPQIVDFSSRGLTADRRVKPDIVATGFFAYSSTLADFSGDGVNDTPIYFFGSGTSFSTPTVAGAAALVTAFARKEGRRDRAPHVARALMESAQPIASFGRVGRLKQGRGFVYLPGAFDLIDGGRRDRGQRGGGDDGNSDDDSGSRGHDDLSRSMKLRNGHAEGDCPPLAPGESFDFLVEVPRDLSNLHMTFPNVTTHGIQNPITGDGLEVTVHSAKRGGNGDYVFFSSPVVPGDSFDFPVPEPGTVRVTMSGLPINYGEVSGSFTMDAQGIPFEADHRIRGKIRHDGVEVHTVEVPAGLDALAVRLSWRHDWQRFPTYDLDLLIQSPAGLIPAATLDSPELAWIEAPPAGEWTFVVSDFSTVRGREHYVLEIAEVAGRPRESVSEPVLARPQVLSASPNPAAGATTVKFVLPASGRARVDVFDVAGRLVRTVMNDQMQAGQHQVRWDGRSTAGGAAADGIYFVHLRTKQGTSTRKVLLKN